MQWLGKGVGGLIGAIIAGPFGSLIGILLGHQWDQNAAPLLRGAHASVREISQLFFEVAFEIMGRVAKVDGRVSEDEIRVARRIMDGLRLSSEQVQVAIRHFTRGKSADYAFDARIGELAEQIGDRGALARAFVQLQLQSAAGAGEIGPEKRRVLWDVARALGVSRAELAQIEALVRGYARPGAAKPSERERLEEAYKALGLAPDAGDDDIKKAYRRLMNQHHPDKLVARGLPQSMIGVAEQKTHEIRAAYERLKEHRGFR